MLKKDFDLIIDKCAEGNYSSIADYCKANGLKAEETLDYEVVEILNTVDTNSYKTQVIDVEGKKYLELPCPVVNPFKYKFCAKELATAMGIGQDQLYALMTKKASLDTNTGKISDGESDEKKLTGANAIAWLLKSNSPLSVGEYIMYALPILRDRQLTDLYFRVINRINRYNKLVELDTPRIIMLNECHYLQNAIDELYFGKYEELDKVINRINRCKKLVELDSPCPIILNEIDLLQGAIDEWYSEEGEELDKVINRINRCKKLVELGSPCPIILNEIHLLQSTIDELHFGEGVSLAFKRGEIPQSNWLDMAIDMKLSRKYASNDEAQESIFKSLQEFKELCKKPLIYLNEWTGEILDELNTLSDTQLNLRIRDRLGRDERDEHVICIARKCLWDIVSETLNVTGSKITNDCDDDED